MRDFKKPIDRELWDISNKLDIVNKKLDNIKRCIYIIGGFIITIIIDIILMYINNN